MKDLNAQLGSAPVSSLGVVSDFVISSKSNPVRNRLVLLLLDSKGALGAEALVGRLEQHSTRIRNIRGKNISKI